MKCVLLAAASLAIVSAALAQGRAPVPTDRFVPSPFDGVWSGSAPASGSCPALTVRITVEGGAIDGIASEPDVPASRVAGKKGETLPVPPALWQLHGRVQADGSIKLIGLRAMKDRNRQNASWSGRAAPGSITLSESGAGCARTATLSRSG